jgi:hypothetical protein
MEEKEERYLELSAKNGGINRVLSLITDLKKRHKCYCGIFL